jgi:D-alanyl-D-alanine carboxypeptidase
MNVVAGALRATDTHFVNAHGLDAPGHYSSARDLATIAAAVLRQPVLARIVATPIATVQTPVGSAVVENRNPLLETYEGAIGVKTGQTLGAGNVLVAAARRNGRTIIAVAMHSADAESDARALLDYGFAIPKPPPPPDPEVVLEAAAPVASLVFDPAGSTGVIAGGELEAVIGKEEDVQVIFRPSDSLELPLESGDKIGSVDVLVGDEMIGSVDAIATRPVDLPEDESLALKLVSSILRTVSLIVPGSRG